MIVRLLLNGKKSLSTETTFPRDLRSPQNFFQTSTLAFRFSNAIKSRNEENNQRPNKKFCKNQVWGLLRRSWKETKQSDVIRYCSRPFLKAKKLTRIFSAKLGKGERRPIRLIGIGVRFARKKSNNLNSFLSRETIPHSMLHFFKQRTVANKLLILTNFGIALFLIIAISLMQRSFQDNKTLSETKNWAPLLRHFRYPLHSIFSVDSLISIRDKIKEDKGALFY